MQKINHVEATLQTEQAQRLKEFAVDMKTALHVFFSQSACLCAVARSQTEAKNVPVGSDALSDGKVVVQQLLFRVLLQMKSPR